MPIAWPASLPQAPLFGYNEEIGEVKVRTQTDSGPAKVRRRFTESVDRMTWGLALTESQFGDLLTFYKTTTSHGSQRFEITHPRTAALVEVRLVGPPSFSNPKPNLYKGSLVFEILPQ